MVAAEQAAASGRSYVISQPLVQAQRQLRLPPQGLAALGGPRGDLAAAHAEGRDRPAVRSRRRQASQSDIRKIWPFVRPSVRRWRSHEWCGREDSNLHALRRWNLNPVRLPVPPHPQRPLHRALPPAKARAARSPPPKRQPRALDARAAPTCCGGREPTSLSRFGGAIRGRRRVAGGRPGGVSSHVRS